MKHTAHTALEDTERQRETEAMLRGVEAANTILAFHDMSLVVERDGQEATAIVLMRGPDGESLVLTRRAGNDWRDAIGRALEWALPSGQRSGGAAWG